MLLSEMLIEQGPLPRSKLVLALVESLTEVLTISFFFKTTKLKAHKIVKSPCEAVGLTAVSFSDNKRHMPSRM